MQESLLQQLILEAAEVVYCVVDSNDVIIQVSRSFCNLFELTSGVCIGKPLSAVIPPSLNGSPMNLNQNTSQEAILHLASGKILQLLLSPKKHLAPENLFLYIFTDLTMQRQVEQDLVRTTKDLLHIDSQLQAVLDAVPAYISWVSKDGTYLGVNQHLANLLGLRVGDVVGERVGFRGDDVFEQIAKTFFLSDERQISAEYRITINDKSLVNLLFGHKYSDGSAAVFVGVDISSRKLMEEQLREQAKLLEVTRDAIIVVDENDVVRFWNSGAELLYGWKREDAVGNRKSDLLSESSEFKHHFEAQARVLEKGEWQGELQQTTRTGRKIIVQSRRTLLDSIVNQPKKVLIVNSDITEKKALELQAHRNQRVENIGMIASGIAHDMNNILTPIMASIEMLKMNLSDEKNLKRISMLETSAHRGKALMEQILNFTRGKEGESKIFDVRHLIKDITTIIEQTFPKSITVDVSIDKNLYAFKGDATQLHQVLMNLVVNARDAMPNGGKIFIRAKNIAVSSFEAQTNIDAREGDYLLLSIEDTGGGIPTDLLNHVFDPFFTTKEEGKGTGLGLSTVLTIVRAHRGFLTVDSQVGRGTNFNIYLPPALEQEVESQLLQSQSFYSDGKGEIVLIVDDEDAICEVAAELLESVGYQTLTAKNGEQALALFTQYYHQICLVITDMVMPVMDGASLIRSLRAVQPNLNIIAMSGLMDKEKLMKMAGVEKSAFITKPFTGEMILTTVRNLLREEKLKV